jgi:hypothetical protein
MLHRSGGIEDRLASTSPTESSIVFTEAYNTGFEGTPLRDLSTPPPTHFWRPQFSEEDYDRMCEIKEEEYEPDISDGAFSSPLDTSDSHKCVSYGC